MPTASPARTSLARLRTGPSSKPSSAPPLAGACRRSSSRVGRPLRGRGPTPLCLTLPACCDAPPPLRPGALALPAARGRPCAATIAHTPSLGAFSLICVPSTPPGRCRQHRFMRASPLRRVVAVGPCVYRVLYVSYVRRGVTVRDNGTMWRLNRLLIPFLFALHASAHYTLYYTPITHSITPLAITPPITPPMGV